ncbi:zinc-dependent metalloprotease [Flavobacterium sp. Fl-77]|uniref:Zinc-dependent metalloprotease n=1 Tax=Flavobacterium flavipigmentatum TaxID=2893884 RepID=A0AAJ2VXC6_9FLAO|nr:MULTISPECIES: zinc-dependent metalloprotease [unclassified Flavobacterium]MDX6183448.1 zinc-dependent metalloprotease [Flavobacterium sp. Fl-33]MDX6186732.1 zinc-dependent metalloprotease [Flavobacterium sp. Fl-77]UFH38500.1 zinc-dependent metalloprotease [Flavobacterium sp. F-70]
MREKALLTNLKNVALVALLLSTSSVISQKKNKKDKDKTEQVTDSLKASKGKNYNDLVKKGTFKKGLFNTIQVKTDLYLEINDSLFQREFLVVNKISNVPMLVNEEGLNRGMNYENKIITFHKDLMAKKVWVKSSVPKVSSPVGDAITASVNANFSESIIEVFDIETKNDDSTSVVIKANKVFDGKQKSFNDILSNIGIGSSVKSELSYIESVKTFPNNIVVKSQLTTSINDNGIPSSVTIGITSNIILLDKVPMQARFADNRVGYFSEKHWYFSDNQQAVREKELITRWRLEPKKEDLEKYKNGELVEPKKPIVYYIDPSTPKQWRSYIIEGVRDWQIAFEKAGFKNAVIAKEPTDEDTDFDIDDVRYSVITYVASQKSNAMGPAVVDPRSGEIIESDIIWWHNVMTSLHSWMRIQTGAIDPKARGNKFTDEHMGEAIRFVSSHEVGHTFGLKHNMGASFAYDVESLRSPDFTAKMGGTAPSIMDYARYNYIAQPEDHVEAITPKIGEYDKYAIEWGYRWYANENEEHTALNNLITKHQNDPLYFYGEQQSLGTSIDPRSQSEDLGNDAMKAGEYGLKNLKRVVGNILDWTYDKDESYYETGKLYISAIGQWNLYNYHVLTNLGGIYLNPTVHGDNKASYVPVPAAVQKRAVAYLLKNSIALPEWLFFNPILDKTNPIKDTPLGPYEITPYTLARDLQYDILYKMLSDERLLRITENELFQRNKTKDNVFTVTQLFKTMRESIFASTIQNKSLTILERLSQKNYVDVLIVSANKLFEKTEPKKSIEIQENLSMPHLCDYLEESRMARNINQSFMKRVSEVTSDKKGELNQILQLLKIKRNSGNQETKNHYFDLIQRIERALNNTL